MALPIQPHHQGVLVPEVVLEVLAIVRLHLQVAAAGAGAGAAVVTPEMRVGLEAQEERAEQEPPQTFNCVPVTPGCTAPITVASPGGQIVISWNPQ
jgi:hypothetical protein